MGDGEVWREQANCRGTDLNLFFPERGASGGGHMPDALDVCRPCPVRAQCFEFACATNQPEGIWGGTTEGQRRKMRRWRTVVNRLAS